MAEHVGYSVDFSRPQFSQKERFFALTTERAKTSFRPSPQNNNDELEQTLSELGKYAAQRRQNEQKPTIFMSAASQLPSDKEELLDKIANDLIACQAEVLTSHQLLFGKEHEKNGYDLATYVQKVVLEMPKYQYIIPVGTAEYLNEYNKRDEKPQNPMERLEKKILKAVSKIGEQASKKDDEDEGGEGEGARVLSILLSGTPQASLPSFGIHRTLLHNFVCSDYSIEILKIGRAIHGIKPQDGVMRNIIKKGYFDRLFEGAAPTHRPMLRK